MPYRVSFRFQQQSAKMGGWTENFWSNLGSIPAVDAEVQLLQPALDSLHGNTSFMTGVRISNALNFRDVLTRDIPIPPGPFIAAGSESDYPTSALLYALMGTGQYKTVQWLRGIWDPIVRNGGYYQPTASFLTNLGLFRGRMLNAANGWCIRVADRTIPFRPIKDISQAGVVQVTGHGYADNSKVRISRCKGLTQANQIWRITRIDADSFSLQGWVQPNPAQPYLGNGVARQQVLIFVPVTGLSVVRATEHKVGRPLGQLSGRRTTRRT